MHAHEHIANKQRRAHPEGKQRPILDVDLESAVAAEVFLAELVENMPQRLHLDVAGVRRGVVGLRGIAGLVERRVDER